MAKTEDNRPLARLARGFQDRPSADVKATEALLAKIRAVYETYGFEPVETPLIEYADALGKFLPDQDRPNEGVFSFQDDDEQWLALRYDLTAPLARHVAENFERLPKPYRSYRAGWVFRNEKPGPGRFRQFMQFDADTVGSASPAADAEIAMLMADTMEAIGIPRGDYVIKVSSRGLIDSVLSAAKVPNARRLVVLRAFDKIDRLGAAGVRDLLSEGRKDESGDWTSGANLEQDQIKILMDFICSSDINILVDCEESEAIERDDIFYPQSDLQARYDNLRNIGTRFATTGINLEELRAGIHIREMFEILTAAGYGSRRIKFDPAVVRGLEYYTGPVFEAELTFEITDEKGRPQRFGSVGGGGRYDGLVGRFRGDDVPATGFSVGVSRLQAALAARNAAPAAPFGPVIVTVMDRNRFADYQRLAMELRAALNPPGAERIVPVEVYLGTSGMKAQLKYADRRNAPCVIIQGSDEHARGEVQVKDMAEGKRQAATIADNETWRAARPAQFSVPVDGLAAVVRDVLAAAESGSG